MACNKPYDNQWGSHSEVNGEVDVERFFLLNSVSGQAIEFLLRHLA